MNNKKAQDLYKKGLRSLKRNNLVRANFLFDRALELQPNNIRILLDKGILLKRSYRLREALNVFETILKIEPSNKIAQENKNYLLKELEKQSQLLKANPIHPVNRPQRPIEPMWAEERFQEFQEFLDPYPHIPIMPSYWQPSSALFEKKINEYITLKFENNRTIIYVAGRRIIQCVHLILNIKTRDVPMYENINSIDEAADIYRKQGRNVGHAVGAGFHQITPEQEFWGHCSNIQAWVENDYDTRILMSNLAFPLLRELTRAGDPVAKRVYKEEVAQRLESGYPSVVQYLLSQGFLSVFTPSEFKTILEATAIIKNLSVTPDLLYQFLRSCVFRFPTLVEDILLSILNLQNSKNIIFSMVNKKSIRFTFRTSLIYSDVQFLELLQSKLESILIKVEEEELQKEIIDCINLIRTTLEERRKEMQTVSSRGYESVRDYLDQEFLDLIEERGMERQENLRQLRERVIFEIQQIMAQMREDQANRENNLELMRQIIRFRNRCAYCGREIPPRQDICDWCGHRRRDDDDFFPYPFIFRRPDGGGGGSMKAVAIVPSKTQV